MQFGRTFGVVNVGVLDKILDEPTAALGVKSGMVLELI